MISDPSKMSHRESTAVNRQQRVLAGDLLAKTSSRTSSTIFLPPQPEEERIMVVDLDGYEISQAAPN